MAHKMPPMPALAPGRKIRLAEVVAGAVPPGGSVAVVGRYVRTRSHLLSPLALPFWVSLHRLCGRRCDRADGGEGQGPSQGGGRLLTVLFFGRLLLVVYAPLPRPLCAGGGFLRSARGGVGIMVAVLLPHNPPLFCRAAWMPTARRPPPSLSPPWAWRCGSTPRRCRPKCWAPSSMTVRWR